MAKRLTITLDDVVYHGLFADEEREAEAMEWTESLVGDLVDETR